MSNVITTNTNNLIPNLPVIEVSMVNPDEYYENPSTDGNIMSYIASGGFADIYKSHITNNNRYIPVALKLHKKPRKYSVHDENCFDEHNDIFDTHHVLDFTTEAEIMKKCNDCQYIIHLYGIQRDHMNCVNCLVLELAMCSLSDMLYKLPIQNELSSCDPLGLVYFKLISLIDICSALEYLHNLGISHNDIKPDNVFITVESMHDSIHPRLVFKLADFGLASEFSKPTKVSVPKKSNKHLHNKSTTNTLSKPSIQEVDNPIVIPTHLLKGNYIYQAPEIFIPPSKCSAASDVYGFAIMLNETLCNKNPLSFINGSNIPLQVYGGVRPNIYNGCCFNTSLTAIDEDIIKRLQHIIRISWDSNIKTRPTIKSIKTVLHKVCEILKSSKVSGSSMCSMSISSSFSTDSYEHREVIRNDDMFEEELNLIINSIMKNCDYDIN